MKTLRNHLKTLALLAVGLVLISADKPANNKAAQKSGGGSKAQSRVLLPVAGPLDGSTLVGAPDATIRLNTWFEQPTDYYYTWGPEGGSLDRRSETRSAPGRGAVTEVLGELKGHEAWAYQVHWRPQGEASFRDGNPGRFVTPRSPGQTFRFVIEADPHLDENADAEGYLAALEDMAVLAPDFCVDLGDASMVGKLASTPAEALNRNLVLRSYWDELGGRSPFFMVLGNHDGEVGWSAGKGDLTSEDAREIRRSLFPNPDPSRSTFYRGLSDTAYAFTWGDALIVVLDPYNPSTRRTSEGTEWTLGKAQIDWLANTLRSCRASFKFVFIHHLVGKLSNDARGGAEAAAFGEWGTQVHPLLVETHVNAVFHGHDHFYSREAKDGVVYQLVPQPSAKGKQDVVKNAEEYGYSGGDNLPSPGFLLITVEPRKAIVELRVPGSSRIPRSYSFLR